jgi:CubicO group peptidase (beta-lactamase class C family)
MSPVNEWSAAADRTATFGAQLCANFPVPGGVLALVDNKGTVVTRSWGTADAVAGTAMTDERLFEIGSISKTFVSLLVHVLETEGLLNVDSPAQEYLPWLHAGTPNDAVTLRQLLSHTAGFILGADHLPDERAQVWDLRELTRDTAGQFHYSNAGYMVLSQVVQAVTGQSLGDAMAQRLFAPMGMESARGDIVHTDRAQMAIGHWPLLDDRPWIPGDPIAHATWFEVACGDGNIAAHARDLAQLVVLLTNNGTVGDTQVVSPEIVRAITTPTAPQGEPLLGWPGLVEVSSSRYGLGVNVEEVDGHRVVTHGGGMVGYSTFLIADLDAGVGAVVLTNGNGEYPAAQVIARTALALVNDVSASVPTTCAVMASQDVPDSHVGRFSDGELSIDVMREGSRVLVNHGQLLRTLNERFTIDDPELRAFHLYMHNQGWSWGSHRLLPGEPPKQQQHHLSTAVQGHYRCYSPWYPNFRIVAHSGSLFLVAPGGIEAHTDECELVEVAPGVFRIGLDPLLPERLTLGPVVDGQCIWVERDGMRYSRAFTD